MKMFVAISLLLLAGCTGTEENSTPSATPRLDSTMASLSTPIQADVDRSPMDMIYFPVDFTVKKTGGEAQGTPMARVIYSRPHRQGRTIFGQLVPYGQPWRLGANEATEIELFNAAIIQDKAVAKGRYILYCIPQQDSWTIIFNNNLYTWGLKPDTTKDAYRFEVPAAQDSQRLEYFTMRFVSNGSSTTSLHISWDGVMAMLPMRFR